MAVSAQVEGLAGTVVGVLPVDQHRYAERLTGLRRVMLRQEESPAVPRNAEQGGEHSSGTLADRRNGINLKGYGAQAAYSSSRPAISVSVHL
jgi:hypothetical protein